MKGASSASRGAQIRRRARELTVGAALPVVLFVVLYAPCAVLGPMGRVLSFAHRKLFSRERRILRANLERVLRIEPDSDELRRMMREVSIHQVASVLETVREIFRPGSAEVAGLDELESRVRSLERAGHGQLLVTAHLGSWELLARSMAAVGTRKFYSLAKPGRIAATSRFLERMRERAGTGVLWVGRQSLLREMLEVLARGEWLGFAMDQKPTRGSGLMVQFFGRPTEFVTGPATLAVRQRCGVLLAFCVREAPFRYRVVSRELLAADHDETDERAMTQRMATAIEEMIRRYPTQWPWTYRRWRFQDEVRSSGVGTAA